jgi:hypothetical protein
MAGDGGSLDGFQFHDLLLQGRGPTDVKQLAEVDDRAGECTAGASGKWRIELKRNSAAFL